MSDVKTFKVGDEVVAPPWYRAGTVTYIKEDGIEFESQDGVSWTFDPSELTLASEQKDLTNKAADIGVIITLDGSDWCALHGQDLQVGHSGHGATPEDAILDLLDDLLNG